MLPAIFPNIEKFSFEANVHGFLDEIPPEIMPSYNKGEWGDLIEGKIKGRKFALNELHLIFEQSSSSSSNGNHRKKVTKFKGVAIRAKLSQKVPHKLIMRNGRAAVTRWMTEKTGLAIDEPHISFDDKDFDTRHDVHCNNEQYAQQVFSERGIAQFRAMQKRYSTGDFQFVASKRTLTMMIEQKYDFFEIPPLEQPFDDKADVARLREEVGGFLALLEDMEQLLAAN